MKAYLSIILAFAFVGCAVTPRDADLRAIAIQTFGNDTHLMIHKYDSRLSLDREGLPTSTHSTKISDLWSDMQLGESENLDLVVRGYSSAGDARMIEDALWIGKAHRLSHLRLLFIGNLEDAERIRPKVEAKGAQFYFVQR